MDKAGDLHQWALYPDSATTQLSSEAISESQFTPRQEERVE